jgi:hypothetical protein
VRLSSHTAQASQRLSLTGRPASASLRWLHNTDRGQPSVSAYGRTSRSCLPPSAFPYESCLSGFLVTRHLLEVCSFSRRANSEPVSTPLQRRHSLSPASFTRYPIDAPCGFLPLLRRITGLPCFSYVIRTG